MTFPIPVCAVCGRAAFPPRVLCPSCGAREWTERNVASGIIEQVTAHDGVGIASLQVEPGVLLIVRLDSPAAVGQIVGLAADGDVPVAASE